MEAFVGSIQCCHFKNEKNNYRTHTNFCDAQILLVKCIDCTFVGVRLRTFASLVFDSLKLENYIGWRWSAGVDNCIEIT